MKVGVFGDVHANLPALRAVLAALDEAGCDELICTGDVVGYGPSPAECIAVLRERGVACVLGNHDKYVTLIMDPALDRLDPDTRAVIDWTQSVLSMDDLRWLAELPLRLDFEGFCVVHGSLGRRRWQYLVDERALAEHFAHQKKPLAFSGHSHLPIIGLQAPDRPPRMTFLKKGPLPRNVKVVINPGSVGQPRDRDPRAACVVYDADEHFIQPLRVEYDIAQTQELMRKAGLPERFIKRLAEGR